MNVVHINNYHDILGGSEVVMNGEISGLREQGINVYQIVVGKSSKKTSRLLVLKESRIKYSFFRISVLIKVFFWLRRLNIDVAHLHIYYGRLSNSILLALRLLKIPVVQSVHEYRRLCPNYKFLDNRGNVCELCPAQSRFNSVRKRCIHGSIYKSLLVFLEIHLRDLFFRPESWIDHFIYVSGFIRDKHQEYLGISEHSVLWNFTFSSGAGIRNRKKDYDLIFVGRLSREKGLLEFLDLLGQEVKVAIVGDGILRAEVELLASKNKNIAYLGFLPNNEVKTEIEKARFLLLPSLWYENNPVIVMESFSVGVPVIGSRIGGIPEIVTENETGFLLDVPFDKKTSIRMKEIIDISHSEYARLQIGCYRFYEKNFTLDTHITRLLRIYTSIADSKKR